MPSVRCKADLVFAAAKVCVFADGCFWHGCPLHFKVPRAHAGWWAEKIEQNVARDRRQTEQLTALGWEVVRFWEHDLEVDPDGCAARVVRAVEIRASSSAARTKST